MSDVLVVGDDLTGSNGTANGLVRRGLRSGTMRAGPPAAGSPETDHLHRVDRVGPYREVFDALVVTTDSRHLPPAEAAALTREAVRAGWPARLVASRCDSTLRGNVGPEAEAVLSAVAELSGTETIGLCMPAFPSADRQTLAGLQLMGGRRLEQTELARDVRSPMTTSSVEEVLGDGTRLRCAHIGIAEVTAGGSVLEDALGRALETRPDVLIADACTDEHLAAIARAAVAVRPGAMWVTIDPGPGTWAMTEALGLGRDASAPASEEHSRTPPTAHVIPPTAAPAAPVPAAPVLAVSGSATELTRTQLGRLAEARECTVVRARYSSGAGHRLDIGATAEAVRRALAALTPGASDPGGSTAGAPAPVVLLATVLGSSDLLDLSAEEGDAIPAALGEVVAQVLAAAPVRGLYTTGGDITTAVLDRVDGAGIEVHSEVVPLAAAGTIVGGSQHGTPIVTKGGLVGAADTALVCVTALEQLAARQHPQVAAASAEPL
ncbi:four-carbon acid sugar kinase family protein [Brevibacterium album]|uniref:four-carbon acid sugar kinase family protein n=1 Tax=Brevibacterium album TaxID=417948 RepID=UPI000417E78C|nr:four-carbon acid sugar kinase family protein [Brevibacterium album]